MCRVDWHRWGAHDERCGARACCDGRALGIALAVASPQWLSSVHVHGNEIRVYRDRRRSSKRLCKKRLIRRRREDARPINERTVATIACYATATAMLAVVGGARAVALVILVVTHAESVRERSTSRGVGMLNAGPCAAIKSLPTQASKRSQSTFAGCRHGSFGADRAPSSTRVCSALESCAVGMAIDSVADRVALPP
jgi:hypothetical protein